MSRASRPSRLPEYLDIGGASLRLIRQIRQPDYGGGEGVETTDGFAVFFAGENENRSYPFPHILGGLGTEILIQGIVAATESQPLDSDLDSLPTPRRTRECHDPIEPSEDGLMPMVRL